MYKTDFKKLEQCLKFPPIQRWLEVKQVALSAREVALVQKIIKTPQQLTRDEKSEINVLEPKIMKVLKEVLKTVPKL